MFCQNTNELTPERLLAEFYHSFLSSELTDMEDGSRTLIAERKVFNRILPSIAISCLTAMHKANRGCAGKEHRLEEGFLNSFRKRAMGLRVYRKLYSQ